MYCKYCGTSMADDARFCPSCGAQTQGQDGNSQQAWQQQPAQPQNYQQQSYHQSAPPPAQSPYGRFGGQNFIPPAAQGRNPVRRAVRRNFRVSARPQARLCGIPISGTAAVVILIILVIVCLILNRTGVLS